MRLSFCCLLLASCAVLAIAGEASAVPRESQEEKEVNLKRQATGGLVQKWTFDQDQPQKAPAGFTALASGEGGAAEWTVQTDVGAPSPTQIVAVSSLCEAEPCDQLLLATGFRYEYPDLTVSFRVREGASGIGGVVLGAQDASNFYGVVVDLADRKSVV